MFHGEGLPENGVQERRGEAGACAQAPGGGQECLMSTCGAAATAQLFILISIPTRKGSLQGWEGEGAGLLHQLTFLSEARMEEPH